MQPKSAYFFANLLSATLQYMIASKSQDATIKILLPKNFWTVIFYCQSLISDLFLSFISLFVMRVLCAYALCLLIRQNDLICASNLSSPYFQFTIDRLQVTRLDSHSQMMSL